MRKNAARGRTTTLARQLNVDAGPVLPINCMVNSPAASTDTVTDRAVLPSVSASATQVVGISQNDTTSEAPETYSTTDNTFIEPHSTATVDSEPPVHPRAIRRGLRSSLNLNANFEISVNLVPIITSRLLPGNPPKLPLNESLLQRLKPQSPPKRIQQSPDQVIRTAAAEVSQRSNNNWSMKLKQRRRD